MLIRLKIPFIALALLNFKFEKLFSHAKERIKMRRGLEQNRKKKVVKFLLKNLEKNRLPIVPFFNYNLYFKL